MKTKIIQPDEVLNTLITDCDVIHIVIDEKKYAKGFNATMLSKTSFTYAKAVLKFANDNDIFIKIDKEEKKDEE